MLFLSDRTEDGQIVCSFLIFLIPAACAGMFRLAGVQYHINAAAYLPKPASVGTGPFSFFMAPPLCFKVIGFLFPFRNGRDPCLFQQICMETAIYRVPWSLSAFFRFGSLRNRG